MPPPVMQPVKQRQGVRPGLRAGTTQKMARNMLSTDAMVKLGKVYGNFWSMCSPLTKSCAVARCVSWRRPPRLLDQVGWQVKTAVVMGLTGVAAPTARQRLATNKEQMRMALASRGEG